MLSSYVRTKIRTSLKLVLLMLSPGSKNHSSANTAHKNLILACNIYIYICTIIVQIFMEIFCVVVL